MLPDKVKYSELHFLANFRFLCIFLIFRILARYNDFSKSNSTAHFRVENQAASPKEEAVAAGIIRNMRVIQLLIKRNREGQEIPESGQNNVAFGGIGGTVR